MISTFLNLFRLLKAIKRSWSNPSFRSIFVLAISVLLSGTIFYRGVEGWTWVDSFYFSVTTAATVGFGDLSPKTDAGKLFTTLYIFVSVGVVVMLFTEIAKVLLKLEDEET